MSKTEQHYLSYILRLWAETHESDLVWRASLEDVQSGERIGFSGLAGLILFLEAKGVTPANLINTLSTHDRLNETDSDLLSGL